MPRRDNTFSVTSATRSRIAEIEYRQRNYAITMGVRTACFLLAAFLPGIPMIARLALLFGSLVLPWVAVSVANAGRVPEAGSTHLIDRPERVQIGPGPRGVVEMTVDGYPGEAAGQQHATPPRDPYPTR